MKEYESPVHYSISSEVGHFTLGSTVVLVFEFLDGAIAVQPQQKVGLGFPLVVKRKDFSWGNPLEKYAESYKQELQEKQQSKEFQYDF